MIIEVPGMPEASSNAQLPDPGRYQFRVLSVEKDMSKPDKPKIVFTYFILDGPQQREIVRGNNSHSPIGMTVKEFVPNQPNCAFRTKNILIAAGVISRDDSSSDKFDTEAVINQILSVDISHKEFNGNKQLVFNHIIDIPF